LYYALWPGRAIAERCIEHAVMLQAAVGGRVTRVDSVHMTLAFLGDVDATRMPELHSPPPTIATEQFMLDIDRIGVWHHNGIGWVAPRVTPESLAELQGRLSDWLQSIGLPLEQRPFRPHVTLLRKATGKVDTVPIESIRWPIDEYVLVQSIPCESGTRYEIRGRFPLVASG